MSGEGSVWRRMLARLWHGGQAGAGSITGHWMLALFSVAAAFVIWMAVQDVGNPVTDATVANDIPIREAVNVPDGFIVDDLGKVTVQVEARKSVIKDLSSSDFDAKVEIPRAGASGGPVDGRVTVTSKRDGVRILKVNPETVNVVLTQAETKEFPVTYNIIGDPPLGYGLSKDPKDQVTIDPTVVQVQGKKELVDTIDAVALDVNLHDARDATTTFEGDLVARTANSNTVQVKMSQTRARATFRIEQVFSQRTIALTPSIVGTPAPGFIVTNVVVDPPTVLVTGPKLTIDTLKTLTIERLDVTGANRLINVTRQIVSVPNVSADRQTVFVRVDIQAIDCGGTDRTVACEAATLYVAPAPVGLPPGLVPDAPMSAVVHVSGPLQQVQALKPADLKATVTFTGAAAGSATYQVKATGPAGIRIDAIDPLTVNLVPTTPPPPATAATAP
jgi:YbbR domain-containing protein